MLVAMKWFGIRAVVLIALSAGVAGCDKCGNKLSFNAPGLPKSCGDNTSPSR